MTPFEITFDVPNGTFFASLMHGEAAEGLLRIARHTDGERRRTFEVRRIGRTNYRSTDTISGHVTKGRTRIEARWGMTTTAHFRVLLLDAQGKTVVSMRDSGVTLNMPLPAGVITTLTGRKLSEVIDLAGYAAEGYGIESELDGRITAASTRFATQTQLVVYRGREEGTIAKTGVTLKDIERAYIEGPCGEYLGQLAIAA